MAFKPNPGAHVASLGACGSTGHTSYAHTNAHTHSFVGSVGNTTLSGGSSGNSAVKISNGDVVAGATPDGAASEGDFQFVNGNISVHDGTHWVQVAGLEKTKIDLIRDELRENFPDAFFDLIMKDLL